MKTEFTARNSIRSPITEEPRLTRSWSQGRRYPRRSQYVSRNWVLPISPRRCALPAMGPASRIPHAGNRFDPVEDTHERRTIPPPSPTAPEM